MLDFWHLGTTGVTPFSSYLRDGPILGLKGTLSEFQCWLAICCFYWRVPGGRVRLAISSWTEANMVHSPGLAGCSSLNLLRILETMSAAAPEELCCLGMSACWVRPVAMSYTMGTIMLTGSWGTGIRWVSWSCEAEQTKHTGSGWSNYATQVNDLSPACGELMVKLC